MRLAEAEAENWGSAPPMWFGLKPLADRVDGAGVSVDAGYSLQ
jgi:hypothetical protein